MRWAIPLLAVCAVAVILVLWGAGRGDPPPHEPTTAPDDSPSEVPPPLPDAAAAPYQGEDAVRITGRVTSRADHRPIRGARIRMATFAGTFETVSDRDGGWALTVPHSRVETRPHGHRIRLHELTVSAEGYVSFQVQFEVPRRVKVHWLPFRLDPVAMSLTVRVVDSEGRPVPDAWVRYARDWLRADAVGVFGPVALRVGRHEISAWSEGHGPGRGDVLVLPAPRPKDHEIEVVLSVPRHARGRVVDENGDPVAGATVRQSYDREGPAVLTDEEGRFRWPIDPDEQLAVNVAKPGYALKKVKHKLDPLAETKITIYRAVAAEGVILRADGTPASGVGVAVYDGWGATAVTDEQGRFRLDPLIRGRVFIQVTLGEIPLGEFHREIGPGSTQLTLRLPERRIHTGVVKDRLTGAALEGVEVRVTPGVVLDVTDDQGRFEVPGFPVVLDKPGWFPARASTPNEVWEMAPLGRARLRAVDADGRPAAALAKWTPENPRLLPGWFRTRARADADGVILIDLPAGEPIKLVIEVPGSGAASQTVLVEPGRTTDLGDIRIAGAAPRWTFLVRDEEGRPIPNAFAWRPYVGRIRIADEEGRVAATSARVYITAPGRETVYLELTGTPHGEQEVTLKRSAPVSGRVLDDAGEPLFGVEVEAGHLEAVTDGRGRFVFDGFPVGRAVEVVTDGWEIDRAWAVAGGEEVTLTVPRPGRIRFRFADGGEVAGGTAEFHLLDRSFRFEYEFRPRDRFSCEVLSGRMSVLFEPEGHTAKLWNEVLVEPGRETVLTYDFPKPGPLTGLVTDRDGTPVAGAWLSTVIGGRRVAEADEQGRIRRVWDLAGVARLRVAGHNLAPSVTGPVDLTAGGHIQIALSSGGKVRGRVVRPDGTAVKARVRLGSGEWLQTRDGWFEIVSRVPAGRHVLEVREEGRLPVFREIEVSDGQAAMISVVLPR